MDLIDVVQITLANDQCATFDCTSVTCTNDPSQSFVYDTGEYGAAKCTPSHTVRIFSYIRYITNNGRPILRLINLVSMSGPENWYTHYPGTFTHSQFSKLFVAHLSPSTQACV